MDRSLYPSSVEVDQPTLENTEATKAYHIKQRWADAGNGGIAEGCAVTVGANPIQVDVAAGRAYAPNNELVIVPAAGGLSLSVYTANTRNYVCAVYGEEESRPAARAFDGRTSNTRVQGTARLRVFSKAELDALPLTHTDMSVDARDRTVVLAVVTANGTAVPLTGASIELPPPVFTALVGLDQPQTITGVVFTAIDQETTLTEDATATLLARLLYTPGATPPSTATLSWRMPDDSYGAAVPIPSDGVYTLATDDGQTVTVQVYTNQLPLTPSVNVEEDFEIYDVYSAERFSAADLLHRARTGTIAASRANPHGQRVGDLGDPVADIAHTVRVGGGLVGTAAQAQVPRLTGPQNTNDLYNLWWETPLEFFGLNTTVRVYTNAGGLLYVTSNARWDGTNWNKDEPAAGAQVFGLGSSVSYLTRDAGSPAPWTEAQWTAQPFSLTGSTANFPLRSIFGANLLATAADALLARAQANFATTGRTLLFASQRATSASGTQLRVYRAVAPSTGGAFALEFVFNGAWDDGSSNWVKDDVTSPTLKVSASAAGAFGVRRRAAGSSSPFTDADGAGGWDETGLSTTITVVGGITAQDFRANGSYVLPTGPAFWASVPGVSGLFDNTTDCNLLVGNSWNIASGFQKTGTGAAAQVFFPLRLPHGVVVSACRIYLSLAGAAANGAVVRTAGTGVVQSLDAADTSSIATTTGIEERSLVVDQNLVVDNDLYQYGVWIELPAAATATIYRVEVEYNQFIVTS